jgi:hypothetical protein
LQIFGRFFARRRRSPARANAFFPSLLFRAVVVQA